VVAAVVGLAAVDPAEAEVTQGDEALQDLLCDLAVDPAAAEVIQAVAALQDHL